VRDPNSGWIQLSSTEFFLLWPDSPDVLEVPRAGRTRAARHALIASVSAELAARDLGTVDAPSRDLAGFLRILGSPLKSVDMRVYGDGAPLLGFAGATTRAGAAVARVGDEVRIGPVTPGGLAGPLLAALAPLPAGPERPANVGVADFERACAAGASGGFQRVLRDAGVREDEVATVTRAVASRQGGGQLGVTGRKRLLLSWVDTPSGRYALRRNGVWLTVTPVDLPRLTAMADELLDSV
jgi:hypothetical protein